MSKAILKRINFVLEEVDDYFQKIFENLFSDIITVSDYRDGD